jgi:CspA family cold shock protein
VNGTIKWFNATKGYGFLSVKGQTKEVFAHKTAFSFDLAEAVDGLQVDFETRETAKGIQAVNIKKD